MTHAETTLAEAEHRGFLRGLNVGFVTIGTLAAAAVSYRCLVEAPKFEEVFKQVKVPMPGLTLMVLETRTPAAIVFLIASIVCIWATRSRGQKRSTVVMNALLFGGALFWLTVVSLGLHLPFVDLHHGIGRPGS